jgi:hypothetical protein
MKDKFVVKFEGHDGIIRQTQPMSFMGCELAQIFIPFKNWIETFRGEERNG